MNDLIPLEFIENKIPDRARKTIDLLRGELNRLGYTASDDAINKAWRQLCYREFAAGWIDASAEGIEWQCKDMMQYLGRVS